MKVIRATFLVFLMALIGAQGALANSSVFSLKVKGRPGKASTASLVYSVSDPFRRTRWIRISSSTAVFNGRAIRRCYARIPQDNSTRIRCSRSTRIGNGTFSGRLQIPGQPNDPDTSGISYVRGDITLYNYKPSRRSSTTILAQIVASRPSDGTIIYAKGEISRRGTITIQMPSLDLGVMTDPALEGPLANIRPLLSPGGVPRKVVINSLRLSIRAPRSRRPFLTYRKNRLDAKVIINTCDTFSNLFITDGCVYPNL